MTKYRKILTNKWWSNKFPEVNNTSNNCYNNGNEQLIGKTVAVVSNHKNDLQIFLCKDGNGKYLVTDIFESEFSTEEQFNKDWNKQSEEILNECDLIIGYCYKVTWNENENEKGILFRHNGCFGKNVKNYFLNLKCDIEFKYDTFCTATTNDYKFTKASVEENKWLRVCIRQGKLISKEELNKYDNDTLLLKTLKTEPLVKFKVGKWYKVVFENDNYYIKVKETPILNQNDFSGRIDGETINGNNLYQKTDFWNSSLFNKAAIELTDLSEIQEYLPEGHPDKFKNFKFEIGKWYSFNWDWLGKDCTVIAKIKEVREKDFIISWRSYLWRDNDYNDDDGYMFKDISNIKELSIKEIQPYLPYDHPDKINSISSIPKYVKCVSSMSDSYITNKIYEVLDEYVESETGLQRSTWNNQNNAQSRFIPATREEWWEQKNKPKLVHCKTQEEWDFVIKNHSQASKLQTSERFREYPNIGINILDGCRGSIEWYKDKGAKIYSFEEWCSKFGHTFKPKSSKILIKTDIETKIQIKSKKTIKI